MFEFVVVFSVVFGICGGGSLCVGVGDVSDGCSVVFDGGGFFLGYLVIILGLNLCIFGVVAIAEGDLGGFNLYFIGVAEITEGDMLWLVLFNDWFVWLSSSVLSMNSSPIMSRLPLVAITSLIFAFSAFSAATTMSLSYGSSIMVVLFRDRLFVASIV